jgi:hypothetical protein
MIYTRKYDFTEGTTIVADQIDNEFNAVAQVLNGNIASDNIANGGISSVSLADAVNPEVRDKDMHASFYFSGINLTPTSGWTNLMATINAGVAYIRGKRVVTGGVVNKAFAPNTTTWIDLDWNGSFYYPTGATWPSVTENSIRIAKVVTDGTKITSITDVRPYKESVKIFYGGSSGNIQLNTTGNWNYVETADVWSFIAPKDGIAFAFANPFFDKQSTTTSELSTGFSIIEENTRVATAHVYHAPLYAAAVQYNNQFVMTQFPVTAGKTYKLRWSASDNASRPLIVRAHDVKILVIG